MERSDINQSGKSEQNQEAPHYAELRDYIEEQLENATKAPAEVFKPLTDGLGLDSPTEADLQQTEQASQTKPLIEDPLRIDESGNLRPVPQAPQVPEIEVPELKELKQTEAPAQTTQVETAASTSTPLKETLQPVPPPLPDLERVPWLRRVMAGVLDQAFVITLWAFSMVITLKIVTGSFVGFSQGQPILLNNEYFLYFGILEFAAIWACYLILCIGLLDMTFGMWIWGIRVDYSQSQGSVGLRKVVRTLLSFIFYAPLAPVLLLTFVGKKGRNLLDLLSQTNLAKANG